MLNYKNLKLSLIYSSDIIKLIIRKTYIGYIIGIVNSSSIFLHKQKRFKHGGLFCEEIFGYLYICNNLKCKQLIFNKNIIFNNICFKCDKIMNYNTNRDYRFGSIFFNFPIFNILYLNKFLKNIILFNLVDQFKYFNIYSISYLNYYNSLYTPKVLQDNFNIIVNVFLNFINLFYKFFSSFELFKNKLNLIKFYNKTFFKQLYILNTNISNIYIFKNMFLILFPILPTGLRSYSNTPNNITLNSKFNILYKFMININNKILNKNYYFHYNVKYIFILFLLIKLLLTHTKLKFIFNKNITLYTKLQGKYGIFRQNLLGFRIDYSGRSVIVSSPDLYINYIGLPIDMIKYFLNKKILNINKNEILYYYNNLKVNNIFNNLNQYSFLINRAPTLHKMNTQSFYPIFTEGNAIKFMPITCVGYNADFDGDQMGVFSILFNSSFLESIYSLRSIVNIYSPTNKKNIFNLTQGMLLGKYILAIYNYFNFIYFYILNNYLTLIDIKFNNILINTPILLRYNNYFYLTTVGRTLLNIKNNNAI